MLNELVQLCRKYKMRLEIKLGAGDEYGEVILEYKDHDHIAGREYTREFMQRFRAESVADSEKAAAHVVRQALAFFDL